MRASKIILGVLLAFFVSVGMAVEQGIGASGSYNKEDGATSKKSQAGKNGFNEDGSCDGTVQFFSGKAYECESAYRLKGISVNNCCNGNAYSMLTRHCDDEDQTYYSNKQGKKCVDVGEYCAKSACMASFKNPFTGKKQCWGRYCESTQRGSCCFNSKIARIIHEQGRPQIRMGWGTPQNPLCRGFTADEFQKLDFSKIDLSEYLEDVQSKISIDGIDTGDVEQRLKDNIKKLNN